MNPTRKLLLELEAVEHRKGWDRPPVLGVLVRPRGVFAVAQLFGDFPAGHPPTLIAGAAQQLLDRPDFTAGLVASMPALSGVVLVAEGWAAPPGMTLEQNAEMKAGGLGFADMPGAVETRMVSAVLLDGSMWLVSRVRGRQAEVVRQDGPGGDLEGLIFASLRGLLSTMAVHLPDGVKYLPAILGEKAMRWVDEYTAQETQGATRPNSSNAQ